MDNNKNIFISAYIALGSYFFIFLLFFLYLKVSDIKKFDAFSKDTVLELEILMKVPELNKKEDLKLHNKKQDNKKSKKIVKKSTSISAKQRSDLKSLFANVKTKSVKVKKQITNNIKKSTVTSRFKSKFEKQTKNDNKLLSKILNEKDTKLIKQKTGETKHENDPYISKIYDILYQRWNPLLIIDGLSAKVVIIIYKSGQFKYRVIQYSGDSTFDDQLLQFLEQQKTKFFPPPDKYKINIEVVFTAKGN